MGNPVRGRNNAVSTDEIVVASKHCERVLQAMTSLGIPYDADGIDEDDDLDLVLVPLGDYTKAAKSLKKKYPPPEDERIAEGDRRSWPERTRSAEDLDTILRGLRRHFADAQAGWRPLLAKNRLVGRVIGTQGKVTHGGGSKLNVYGVEPLARRSGGQGAGVVVGVLDTELAEHPWLAGAALSHPDAMLDVPKSRLTNGRVNAPAAQYPNAASGHATFVSGLILKQAPACTVNVLPVLDTNGEASSWAVAKAIMAMARSKPDIINLSLVCYTEDGEPPLVLATAIDRVLPETVVVAAAGNHGDARPRDPKAKPEAVRALRRKPGWPAALAGVLAVGSGTAPGTRDPFTPAGVGWIDVLAKGDRSVSCFPSGFFSAVDELNNGSWTSNPWEFTKGFAEWGGTSFAAASVSGAIAARTVPGTTSAREALAEVLTAARGGRTTSSGNHEPPFISLPR